MIAMTPMGTETFWITNPSALVCSSSTFPTGSGSFTTSRMPWAMPEMRSFVSRSRSSITSEI